MDTFEPVSLPEPSERDKALTRVRLVGDWHALKRSTAATMAAASVDAAWLERMAELTARLKLLLDQDADAALYLMLQTALGEVEHYSANHALFCTVVADLCATHFEWPAEEAATLRHAAMTMNIGMREVQDATARQTGGLSDEQKLCIAEHAERSAELLQQAGVTDELWLETVRRHHRPFLPGEAREPLQPPQRLAQLLNRVDVFTAKLSMRKTRASTSATIAARDACLDPAGLPDAVGATMLRVLGLYPPGSYVQLANGDVGVVTSRGPKAHTPVVVRIRRPDGGLVQTLALCATTYLKHAVVRSLSANEVRVALDPERILGARW